MAGRKKADRKKTEKKKGVLFPALLLAAGMGILFYPMAGSYINLLRQREEIACYREVLEESKEADCERLWEEAGQYNEHLKSLGAPLAEYGELEEEYEAVLDVAGTGMLGYITIPAIEVELPIYHGTQESTLKRAAGHLEGSSLPVGGEGTHAVISAHRGLPGARLFTELDRIKEGDFFYISILDRELAYQVDQIQVVLPTELELLNATEGKDYVTLMTCTPYGINSHRLLVRGIRREGQREPEETGRRGGISAAMLVPAVGVPALFITLTVLLLFYRKKPGKKADGKPGEKGSESS